MSASTEAPLPVNTVVTYHGFHSDGSGQHYVITQHEAPRAGVPDPQVNYPDGVAYVIWPEGMLRKFGNRMYAVYQVRRQSLTVVTLG